MLETLHHSAPARRRSCGLSVITTQMYFSLLNNTSNWRTFPFFTSNGGGKTFEQDLKPCVDNIVKLKCIYQNGNCARNYFWPGLCFLVYATEACAVNDVGKRSTVERAQKMRGLMVSTNYCAHLFMQKMSKPLLYI